MESNSGKFMTWKLHAFVPSTVERNSPAIPNEAADRALGHPEVQRFQELFPDSQVRAVRNLRENEA